jgi:hypothetical protein
MGRVSNKHCRENQTTCFTFNSVFSDNVEKYGAAREATDHYVIRGMRFACWLGLTNVTNTHSEYIIFTTFPGQKLLREGPSVLFLLRKLPVLFYFQVTVSEKVQKKKD